MNETHLHIVTHDVPYPANFGGVIDLFYKIKSLHKLGIKIQLHCFFKTRNEQKELEKYCETVTYYKRKGFESFSFRIPYIVSSRKSKLLLNNLNMDNYPILLEGIHCSYLAYKNYFPNRKIILRLHNVEFSYYNQLAKNETVFYKKMYYLHEANCLKKYEKIIACKLPIFSVSIDDTKKYKTLFNAQDIHFMPVFLPYDVSISNIGIGTYCLYHGNLSVNENEKVAIWLIEKIFSKLNIPLVIAGLMPSKKLKAIAKSNKYISIVESPKDNNLQLLIENAQINILPSFNNTGVKLKLLNALYSGRHCLVNLAGVEGSGLNELCNIAESTEDFKKEIIHLFDTPFSETTMQRRNAALNKIYNKEANALLIHAAIQ